MATYQDNLKEKYDTWVNQGKDLINTDSNNSTDDQLRVVLDTWLDLGVSSFTGTLGKYGDMLDFLFEDFKNFFLQQFDISRGEKNRLNEILSIFDDSVNKIPLEDNRSTIPSTSLTYNPAGALPPPPPPRVDPLVLDLNHDGIINTLSLASSKTFFDLDNDGMSELSGWVAPSDGILVYDRDGNGRIDNINEMFGKANKDGFTELKEVGDSNGDNVFDANDALYNTLRVWTDIVSDLQKRRSNSNENYFERKVA